MTDLIVNRCYRLTRDVENPELDRRKRRDINNLPWEKGLVLRADRLGRVEDGERALITLSSPDTYGCIWPSNKGYADLVAALEPLPENALDVLSEAFGANARGTSIPVDVLVKLYEQGVVTREQLVAATQAVLAEVE